MKTLNKSVKKKQWLLAGLALTTLVAIGVFSVENTSDKRDSKKNTVDEKIVHERYSGYGSNVDEDEIWRATSTNEIEELKAENRELKKNLNRIETNIANEVSQGIKSTIKILKTELESSQKESLEEIRKKQELRLAEQEEKLNATIEQKKNTETNAPSFSQAPSLKKGLVVSQKSQYEELGAYRGEELYKRNGSPILLQDESPSSGFSFGTSVQASKPQSLSFSVEKKDEKAELARIATEAKKKAKEEVLSNVTADTYIPAGSFVRAILLGGIDAPTGANAQSDPYPVLLEIEDIAQLPNSYKYDIKSCRIVSSGYGDISSERAVIRLEKMSCVDDKGNVYESPVQGFIYDETGKAGMKGRLVSKQGQLIANSLMAGIASGLGGALQQSSTNFTTNALGQSQTSFMDAGDAAKSGLGQGVANTFDRLSQYFINLAEQVFPVIEIDAGRMIDVVFTDGVELQPLTKKVLAQKIATKAEADANAAKLDGVKNSAIGMAKQAIGQQLN